VNNDDTLRRALEDDAADIPDSLATLAGIRRGIRRDTLRRRLTIAGAGVLVIAAAAGVPALVATRHPAATLNPATGTHPHYDPLRVPFRIGYVPPGWSPISVARVSTFEAQAYVLAPDMSEVTVDLLSPDDPSPMPTPSGYQTPAASPNFVQRTLPDGRYLMVEGNQGPSADPVTIRRIADSVDLNATMPVTFPFRLTYLPTVMGRLHPILSSVEFLGGRTRTELSFSPNADDKPGNEVLTIQTDTRNDTRGKPDTVLGGYQARVVFASHGKLEVILYNAIPHRSVLLMVPERGRTNLAELEKIAAGIRPVANPDDLSTWTSPLAHG
jgi:hypothetical protein